MDYAEGNTTGITVPLRNLRTVQLRHKVCEDVVDGGFYVGYVRNDRLSLNINHINWLRDKTGCTEFPWIHLMHEWNISLLLFNRGAHFENDGNYTEALRNTYHVLQARYPNVQVFFRNTPEGHVNCSEATGPLPGLPTGGNLPYHWDEYRPQNKLAKEITEAMGCPTTATQIIVPMVTLLETQPGLEADDGSIDWETPDTPASAEDYAFINGRRLVRPYFFEFVAHVKRRWEGKTIVDLFSQEFRQRPMQYYVDAVESGRIRVDGKKVPKTYVVRDSQPISHFMHRLFLDNSVDRHEPPVLAEPVRILVETPDVLTVCKPPSVPIEVNAAVLYDKREGLSSVAVENRPESAERGKDSCTRFMRLSTDGRNSIVKCVPLTGRTHQIRVHLKHLGHPIANDALYLHKAPLKRSREATTADRAAAGVASGSAAECSGYTDTNLLPTGSDVETKLVIFKGCAGKNTHMSSEPCARSKDQGVGTGASMDQRGNVETEIEERPEGQQQRTRGDWALNRVEGFTVDRMCTRCPKWEPAGYEDDVDGIWLHCVKYAGGKWSYEAPLPNWAL